MVRYLAANCGRRGSDEEEVDGSDNFCVRSMPVGESRKTPRNIQYAFGNQFRFFPLSGVRFKPEQLLHSRHPFLTHTADAL